MSPPTEESQIPLLLSTIETNPTTEQVQTFAEKVAEVSDNVNAVIEKINELLSARRMKRSTTYTCSEFSTKASYLTSILSDTTKLDEVIELASELADAEVLACSEDEKTALRTISESMESLLEELESLVTTMVPPQQTSEDFLSSLPPKFTPPKPPPQGSMSPPPPPELSSPQPLPPEGSMSPPPPPPMGSMSPPPPEVSSPQPLPPEGSMSPPPPQRMSSMSPLSSLPPQATLFRRKVDVDARQNDERRIPTLKPVFKQEIRNNSNIWRWMFG